MKKICLLIMFFSLFMLSSCSDENLVNEYFENKKSDDIEVFWDVVDSYDDFIKNHYSTYSKTAYDHESIDVLNNYVPTSFNQLVEKDDLINYELTDNRSYLEGSLSYTYLEVSKHKEFVNDSCQYIKEGIICEGDTENQYFSFYVDGLNAYMTYGQVVNEYNSYQYEMYFYVNEDGKKVFEFFLKTISSDPFLPANHTYKSTLIEDQEETIYTCWNCDSEDDNIGLEYTYHNFQDQTYLSVMVNAYKMYNIHYYDSSKQTYYNAQVEPMRITMNTIEVYDGDIMLVKLNPDRGYYKLNMMPIDGWSSLYEIDDHDYPKNYELIIDHNASSEPMIVHLESRTGEYVYYEYNTFREEVPQDILDLSRFGLESPYDRDFYDHEVSYFESRYYDLLEDIDMLGAFEIISDNFMDALKIG